MHHVIVKLLNGEEKRGDVFSFNMNSPVFYLQTKNKKGETGNQPIKIDLVKQIFFLKKKENNASILHKETIDQSTYAGALPYRLVVELKDGQIIDGSTNKYLPKDKGFFVVPLNPADKSERIYVNAKAVKDVDCKRLLGKKLIDQQKITVEEVEETFRQQRKQREEREEREEEERKETGISLPEKFITTEEKLEGTEGEIKEIKPKPLGEIILEAGYITSKQLEKALDKQKKGNNKRLGQVLVEFKYVTPTGICAALATQCHLPWVDLSSVNIPREVATALPENVVRELEVLPVQRKGNVLVVATAQPQDPSIGMKISKHTPLAVELVIAYEEYIQSAIDRYFPAKE
jgi:hypothetical protein